MDEPTQSQKGALKTVFEASLPALVEEAGEQASRRVVEFFTAEIRNPNTRRPTPEP